MLHIIKTLKYNPRGPKHEDEFSYARDVLLQKIDPSSSANACLDLIGTIYHSPRKRVSETLTKSEHNNLVQHDTLNEIVFDLGKVMSENDWILNGSNSVRSSFLKLFLEDKLKKKRCDIWKSFEQLLEDIEENSVTKCVSHSFTMTLLEAYVATEKKVANEPSLINEFIDIEKKRFGFGEALILEPTKR